jgi:hypothetical protein
VSDLLEDFFDAGNDIKPADVDPVLRALLDRWKAAIRGGAVGFLPRRTHRGTYWYAFAPSARRRRELLGLVDAWVGPTYSDLPVGRGELDRSDPFDAALAGLDVAPLRFEVLPRVAPNSALAKEAVRNALAALTRLMTERPPSQFDALRATVEILDDLGHAIAAQDRALAEACMVELDQAADLDESNMAFLRLRLCAGLGDWAAMFADPAFNHVLSMRRPLGVTRVIQSGLYHERFASLDREGANADLIEAAERLPAGLRDLYTSAPPNTRPQAVVELLCRLLSTRDVEDPAVIHLVVHAAGIAPGLDKRFRRIVEAFAPQAPAPDSGLDVVSAVPPTETTTDSTATEAALQLAILLLNGQFAACVEVALASPPDVAVGRALVHAARQLESVEWAVKAIDYLTRYELVADVAATSAVARADVARLESLCADNPITGWEPWFAELDNGGGRSHAPRDPSQSWEPLSPSRFKHLLEEASESALANLGEYGGQFLAAHSDILRSLGAADLTLRVVAAMALGGRASSGVRVQTLSLLESLESSGPSRETFAEVLEWTAEILRQNVSATTVSWATDIIQTVTAFPAAGAYPTVQSFFFQAVNLLRPFRSALDTADLEALQIVAGELGTEIPEEFRADRPKVEDASAEYRYLDGKAVVLHSLTESAITRAAQVLKRLVPGIDVATNSEHDGSTQLAQLSSSVDLFVVVIASAKHAATTFITEHRQGRPTILVRSRGSSAILRELANYRL